jgi:hypothetical protein
VVSEFLENPTVRMKPISRGEGLQQSQYLQNLPFSTRSGWHYSNTNHVLLVIAEQMPGRLCQLP